MPPHGQSDFTPMDVSAASSSSTPGPQPQATVGAGGLHPSQTQGFGGGGTGFSDLQTSQSNMQGFGGSSQMNSKSINLIVKNYVFPNIIVRLFKFRSRRTNLL